MDVSQNFVEQNLEQIKKSVTTLIKQRNEN